MPWGPIPPRPDLVVLDLAGTTIADRGEVPAAFEAALQESGLAYDPEEVNAWRGASKREVIGRLLARQDEAEPALADRAYRLFRTRLLERLDRAAPLSLPGTHETLARLKADRMGLALTTGFDREVVEAILSQVSWRTLLDAGVYGDDVARGRPAPDMILRAMERCNVDDPRRVAVVGDTRLDLEAAWHAGAAWRVGVLTGAHDRATLEAAPHTHILDAVTALPALWAQVEV
jgi:phosphonatase-like hydrolase